ncbi:MAG: hypothetical protein U5L45_23295 [Saprospiraceae bacterium]|nr:hypothetical protein [Saprospiraceae bacterium]
MVHFSGKARKMNHLSSFCASEASAKVPFNAYFQFMYGFKMVVIQNAPPSAAQGVFSERAVFFV